MVEEEAERVRIIFRRYLELGSLNPTLAPLLLPRPLRPCSAFSAVDRAEPRARGAERQAAVTDNGEGPMPERASVSLPVRASPRDLCAGDELAE